MTNDQQNLLQLIARRAGTSAAELPVHANLTDLGFDSLRFLLLVLEVERMLGRKVVDVASIAGVRTVADVLRLAEAPSPVPPQPQ
jgi:acyl carrier protein